MDIKRSCFLKMIKLTRYQVEKGSKLHDMIPMNRIFFVLEDYQYFSHIFISFRIFKILNANMECSWGQQS